MKTEKYSDFYLDFCIQTLSPDKVEMEIDNDLERETFQKQLYFMTEQLKELHAKLDYDIQSRIPLEDLVETGKNLVKTFRCAM